MAPRFFRRIFHGLISHCESLKSSLGVDPPIAIDNDVKVAAYAEYHAQTLAEDDVFTYITISTGITNASLVNHQMINEAGFLFSVIL